MSNDTHFDATGRGVSLYKKASGGVGTPTDPYIEEITLGAASNDVGKVALSDGPNLGAFGRLRVAGTGQRFDSTFTYDKQPLLFDEIVAGTGTATHDSDLRAIYLSTGGIDSGAAATIRQKYYNPYTPGNSQVIVITGTLNPDDNTWTNARSEIGYGDDENGVGFRYDATGASIFVRSSISGSAADLANVAQANWNGTAVDDVDWTTSQIFLVDFQSLAVGRIRFYLDRDGLLVKVHEVNNDNIRTGPYWQLASLPVYWSVENTGAASDTCRVLAICATVKSEGGPDLPDLPGLSFSADRDGLKTVSTSYLPIFSIQVQTTFNSLANHALVWPEAIDVFCDDQPATFRVIKNGSLTGPSFAQVDASSCVYADTAATAISGGTVISTFYSAASNRGGNTRRRIAGKEPLIVYSGPAGDILTIAAKRTGAVDADVTAAIDWREVR